MVELPVRVCPWISIIALDEPLFLNWRCWMALVGVLVLTVAVIVTCSRPLLVGTVATPTGGRGEQVLAAMALVDGLKANAVSVAGLIISRMLRIPNRLHRPRDA